MMAEIQMQKVTAVAPVPYDGPIYAAIGGIGASLSIHGKQMLLADVAARIEKGSGALVAASETISCQAAEISRLRALVDALGTTVSEQTAELQTAREMIADLSQRPTVEQWRALMKEAAAPRSIGGEPAAHNPFAGGWATARYPTER